MLIVEDKKKLVLHTAMVEEIKAAIPHAKTFMHDGQQLVALNHGVEESLVLRNLGFRQTPAPILSYYNWPARFSPMEHQKQTAAFLSTNKGGLVLSAPGTGKSLSALWAADFLLTEKIVRKVIIVAPLSTVKVVWGKELRHHMPHRAFELLTGSKEQRLRRLAIHGTQFFIVNHDGFNVIKDHLTDVDLVIYDEATALKTPGSQRFRQFFKWANERDVWLWLLTGTPISQSPVDAWTLAKLVHSPNVPKSFTSFRDLVMAKVSTFRWVPRPEALDICQRVLQPSIRYSLEECTEIPDTLFLAHECPMSVEQIKAFKEMKERAVLLSHDVSAPNMAVALQKMIQICCGVVYGNDGARVKLDYTGRYDSLKEIMEEISVLPDPKRIPIATLSDATADAGIVTKSEKVIVFVPLRGVQDSLLDLLRKDGYDVASVHGDVTGTERNKIFDAFQNSDRYHILLAHPKVAAHGLTLTRAKDIIWYAPVYSLEMYEQANARIRRISTEGKTRVHHLYGTTFEKELYHRLQNKRRVLADFLEMIKGVNED
jgi:SNF2 family DNA or RNA helicase